VRMGLERARATVLVGDTAEQQRSLPTSVT
jgi:hypothetical protein